MAPLGSVWQALVDPKVIDKWGGGKAKMSGSDGFNFSLWSGDVHGKNIKVVKEQELSQEWISGDWKEPSIATFKLSHKDGCTTLHLTNSNVPDEEADDIDKGWDDYYLGRIKDLLEK